MPDASGNPNYTQGSAAAALTWLVFDTLLTVDSEIKAVWRASWSISKALYLFTRYHTILALSFFFMSAVGTEHFRVTDHVLPSLDKSTLSPSFFAPCIANLPYSRASRWYLGLTEVLSILCGELLVLIRMNAVYGWSKHVVVLTMLLFCAEALVGLVTTVISLTGGTSALYASQNILDCTPAQRNLPDVNLATWCTSMLVALTYLALILHRASDIAEVVEDAQGHTHVRRLPLREVIKGSRSRMTPMLVVCLRDAAFYFLVMLGAMTLNIYFIITQHRFAQMGTAWMFATYSVATTRIFLNLKNLAARETRYSSMTLSEFGRVSGSGAVSAIEFRSMPGAIRPPHRVWYNVAGREEVYPVTRTRTVSDTPIQTYVDAR